MAEVYFNILIYVPGSKHAALRVQQSVNQVCFFYTQPLAQLQSWGGTEVIDRCRAALGGQFLLVQVGCVLPDNGLCVFLFSGYLQQQGLRSGAIFLKPMKSKQRTARTDNTGGSALVGGQLPVVHHAGY